MTINTVAKQTDDGRRARDETVEAKPSVLLVGNFLQSQMRAFGICEELAARLSASGWAVLTTSPQANPLLRLADMSATAWRRRHEYEVAQVDVYSGDAFVWAEAVCKTLQVAGKPYVLTLRGGNLPTFAKRWPGRVGRLFRSAAIVAAPSRYLYDEMKPYRDDLYLLPNPLDIGLYPFIRRAQPSPRLVWLRAFHEIYNPTMAPKVLALLARDLPDIELTMVGPDKQDGSYEAVQKAAAEAGVSDRLKLITGVPKSQVPEQLNMGDIFLNTTNIDNTPVSVLEAMACGLCVVSTNVGGIPYLLDDEHDSLLVPPDNPEAMAYAVSRVLAEPGLAAKLSQNARLKTEQFDWEVILPKWEDMLRSSKETSKTQASGSLVVG